jgi:hypothetical protein
MPHVTVGYMAHKDLVPLFDVLRQGSPAAYLKIIRMTAYTQYIHTPTIFNEPIYLFPEHIIKYFRENCQANFSKTE